MRLILAFGIALLLAACAITPPAPPPPPATGPVAYNCTNGTQLVVTYDDNQARVAVVGGLSMVLQQAAGGPAGDYYTNGRYGLRGTRAQANWEVGRMAPVACRGS